MALSTISIANFDGLMLYLVVEIWIGISMKARITSSRALGAATARNCYRMPRNDAMVAERKVAMLPRPSSRMARDLAVEQSLDAAIEIDEVIRGERSDAPTFAGLIASLIGSPTEELSVVKKALLADSRLTSLWYRAAGLSGRSKDFADNLDDVLQLLVSLGSADFSKISKDDLSRVRDFCIGLNQELVSEAFTRIPEPPLSRNRQHKLTVANAC